MVDGAAVGLLLAVSDPYVTLLDWVRADLLLAAFALALWGVAGGAVRLRFEPVLASALTVVLALAWLAWPVWLSPWLAGARRWCRGRAAAPAARALRRCATSARRGPSATSMYTRLSVLNQDVAYSLPRGVGPAVIVHTAIGLACLLPYRRIVALAQGRR